MCPVFVLHISVAWPSLDVPNSALGKKRTWKFWGWVEGKLYVCGSVCVCVCPCVSINLLVWVYITVKTLLGLQVLVLCFLNVSLLQMKYIIMCLHETFPQRVLSSIENWGVWRWTTAPSPGSRGAIKNLRGNLKVDFCLTFWNYFLEFSCMLVVCTYCTCRLVWWLNMFFDILSDVHVHVLFRVFRSALESWRRWELSSACPCWGWRGWRGSATTNTCWIWKTISWHTQK